MQNINIRIEKTYEEVFHREDTDEGLEITVNNPCWDLYVDSQFVARTFEENPVEDFCLVMRSLFGVQDAY